MTTSYYEGPDDEHLCEAYSDVYEDLEYLDDPPGCSCPECLGVDAFDYLEWPDDSLSAEEYDRYEYEYEEYENDSY